MTGRLLNKKVKIRSLPIVPDKGGIFDRLYFLVHSRLIPNDSRTIQRSFRKGFGLLEVLVSSVIIITILSALVFIGRSALANSIYTQQKAKAVYLAQEGIESVRQMRDSNWVDGDKTTQFDDIAWDTPQIKLIQATAGTIYIPFYSYSLNRWGLKPSTAGNSDNNVLITNSSTGTSETYSREITIAKIASSSTIMPINGSDNIQKNTQSFKVTVTVKWNYNAQPKAIQVSEIMTNWRPNF